MLFLVFYLVVKRVSKLTMIERSFRKLFLFIAILKIHESFEREIELGPCYLSILSPCANNTIQFHLFYINNSDNTQQHEVLDNIAPILPFDSNEIQSRKFKLVVHGYGGHADVSGFKLIRDGKIKKNFLKYF